ncbi:hypothetical protein Tco_1302021 [Tanacetum coccineum]
MNENENIFVPASMGYNQEMVPKSKDWVERLNPDSKFPNFNTGIILVPESQVVSESLNPLKHQLPLNHPKSETEPTTPSVPTEVKDTEQESKKNELTKLIQMLIDDKVNSNQKTQESNSQIQQTESSKLVDSSKLSQDSKPKVQNTGSSKSLRPKPIQKPQLKEDHRSSYHVMYIASLKRSENYKAQPYQYASPSKQILKAKAKHFPPCTHYGFNDYRPDVCRNYPECEICGSYDHFTSGHIRVIHIRGG